MLFYNGVVYICLNLKTDDAKQTAEKLESIAVGRISVITDDELH